MRLGINISMVSNGSTYSPYSLFAAGEQGVWLDPSDITTLFRDTAGTQPVTAAGQSVALALDKSRGLVLGPEVVNINSLPTPTIGNLGGSNGVWTPATRTMSNTVVGTSPFLPRFQFNFGLTIGATYKISGLLSGNLSSMFVICTIEGTGSVISFNSSTGVISGVFIATTPYVVFVTDGRATYNIKIESLSLQLLSGNHATQATAASRPIYQVDGNGRAYLSFDGVDDFLITPTITPNTDKAQMFAGVRKLSNAARGVVAELSSGATNAGSLNLSAPFDTNLNYQFFSRGSGALTGATSPSGYSAPISNVITGIGDIAADVMQLMVNAVQVATNTGDQGTGNYLAYPMYIGRRGGTTLPFNGNLYSLITRFGPTLLDQQVANTNAWVNSKTGAY